MLITKNKDALILNEQGTLRLSAVRKIGKQFHASVNK